MRSFRGKSLLVVLLVLIGASLIVWWKSLPQLVVYRGLEAQSQVDWAAFCRPLRDAGVRRIALMDGVPDRPLVETPRRVEIAVMISPDRNPALDQEMIALGLTGPGYTIGRHCYVYDPDISLFLAKHKPELTQLGVEDWDLARRRLITNTAIHEAWHGITQSTSHDPIHTESLMFMNPGASPRTYCIDWPLFTRGHKKRLEQRFRPH